MTQKDLQFTIYDVNDNLLGSVDLAHTHITFGGFASDVGIAKGIVTPIYPTNGSIFIDDLLVSSNIPEPSSLILLSTMIFVLGFFNMKKYL